MAPTLKGGIPGCSDISGSGIGFVWNLEALDAENEPESEKGEGFGRTVAEGDPIMVCEAGHY